MTGSGLSLQDAIQDTQSELRKHPQQTNCLDCLLGSHLRHTIASPDAFTMLMRALPQEPHIRPRTYALLRKYLPGCHIPPGSLAYLQHHVMRELRKHTQRLQATKDVFESALLFMPHLASLIRLAAVLHSLPGAATRPQASCASTADASSVNSQGPAGSESAGSNLLSPRGRGGAVPAQTRRRVSHAAKGCAQAGESLPLGNAADNLGGPTTGDFEDRLVWTLAVLVQHLQLPEKLCAVLGMPLGKDWVPSQASATSGPDCGPQQQARVAEIRAKCSSLTGLPPEATASARGGGAQLGDPANEVSTSRIGMVLELVEAALEVLAGSPHLAGLVVGRINAGLDPAEPPGALQGVVTLVSELLALQEHLGRALQGRGELLLILQGCKGAGADMWELFEVQWTVVTSSILLLPVRNSPPPFFVAEFSGEGDIWDVGVGCHKAWLCSLT
jgi:hypothetical protein